MTFASSSAWYLIGIVLDLPTHLYIDRVVGGGSVWHDKNPLCFWRACIIYVIGTTYYKYRATTDVYQNSAGYCIFEHPTFKKNPETHLPPKENKLTTVMYDL